MNYNDEIYAKTKKYQKIYGFGIGQGNHDTWNNEADAFKHTFGSADMALKLTLGISKLIGDIHEYDGNKNMGQPKCEENMDKWNNRVGREIAKSIKKEYNPIQIIVMINNGIMDDIIAEKVMQKMRVGKLITNPNDKRKYVEGKSTGFAVDIEHTFTRDEIDKMSIEEYQKNEKAIMKQMKEKGIPTQQELEKTKSENHSGGSGKWVTINGNHVLLED